MRGQLQWAQPTASGGRTHATRRRPGVVVGAKQRRSVAQACLGPSRADAVHKVQQWGSSSIHALQIEKPVNLAAIDDNPSACPLWVLTSAPVASWTPPPLVQCSLDIQHVSMCPTRASSATHVFPSSGCPLLGWRARRFPRSSRGRPPYPTSLLERRVSLAGEKTYPEEMTFSLGRLHVWFGM